MVSCFSQFSDIVCQIPWRTVRMKINKRTFEHARCVILYGFRRQLKLNAKIDMRRTFNENCAKMDMGWTLTKKCVKVILKIQTWTEEVVKPKIDENPRGTQEIIANELILEVTAVSRVFDHHQGYTRKSC